MAGISSAWYAGGAIRWRQGNATAEAGCTRQGYIGARQEVGPVPELVGAAEGRETMEKQILEQYIDACALIRETEADIRRVKKQRKTILNDRVHGSMKEFPYTAQSFKIQGVAYSVVSDPGALEAYERLLGERKAKAEEIKLQVEVWLNTIPQRMQRIIQYAIFQKLSWGAVAGRLGRNATADSVRMEFQRFMEEK